MTKWQYQNRNIDWSKLFKGSIEPIDVIPSQKGGCSMPSEQSWVDALLVHSEKKCDNQVYTAT